jgi:hypothetical protein
MRRLANQTVFDENCEHAKVERQKFLYVSHEDILTLDGRCRWVVSFTSPPSLSPERISVPIRLEDRWAPVAIWTFRRITKILLTLQGFEDRNIQPVASSHRLSSPGTYTNIYMLQKLTLMRKSLTI